MTDRELLQMALDALEHGLPIIEDFGGKEQLQIQHKAISALYEALRAALAQPEQEPCIHVNNPKGCYRVRCQLGNKCVNDDMSFRTTPPQREWQGLTDEEIGAMEKEYLFGGKEFDDEIGYWAVYRAIEAKLREKNG